jgi:hypothetical protein
MIELDFLSLIHPNFFIFHKKLNFIHLYIKAYKYIQSIKQNGIQDTIFTFELSKTLENRN